MVGNNSRSRMYKTPRKIKRKKVKPELEIYVFSNAEMYFAKFNNYRDAVRKACKLKEAVVLDNGKVVEYIKHNGRAYFVDKRIDRIVSIKLDKKTKKLGKLRGKDNTQWLNML